MSDIGQNIKHLLVLKGISQSELAAEIGKSAGSVKKYIYGEREPSLSTTVEIAKALGVSLDLLITGQEYDGSQSIPECRHYDISVYGECVFKEVVDFVEAKEVNGKGRNSGKLHSMRGKRAAK